MSSAATWMDPETVTLNEADETQKDKPHMVLLTRGIQNTAQTNRDRLRTEKRASWLPRGKRLGKGGTGSLPSAEANQSV